MSKMAKFANLSIQRRGELEQQFLRCRADIEGLENSLRVDRVYAGQALLELKEGFNHGDWRPYLAKLCERAKVAERTARLYMQDAVTASKIPQAVLAEAKSQGFNTEARDIRQSLVNWLLEHPDDAARTPKAIVRDALGAFEPPEPPLTAEQQEAEDERQKAFGRRFASHVRPPRLPIERRRQQETLALQIIDVGYKTLAKRAHPDAGGTNENFQLLKEATNLLQAALRDASGKVQ